MNADLSMLLSLRRVLESAGGGKGMSRSLVEELAGVRPLGTESARRLLLGFPLSNSLRPLVERGSDEVSILASLIVSAPRSSISLVGRSGGFLAKTLERWVKVKENSTLEHRVMKFRSLVTSGVLGAVTAMVASLGPLVGSLDFSSIAPPVNSLTFIVAAAAMTAISSGMLGYFMSGRGFYLNLVASLLLFSAVSVLVAPLVSIPSLTLWGVK